MQGRSHQIRFGGTLAPEIFLALPPNLGILGGPNDQLLNSMYRPRRLKSKKQHIHTYEPIVQITLYLVT